MAAEPKRRHSKARKRTRRAAINLSKTALVKCSNCGQDMIPHRVCPNCGHYRTKQVQIKQAVKVTKA